MKITFRNKLLALTLAGLAGCLSSLAQGDKANRPGPPATATGEINGATIMICYGISLRSGATGVITDPVEPVSPNRMNDHG